MYLARPVWHGPFGPAHLALVHWAPRFGPWPVWPWPIWALARLFPFRTQLQTKYASPWHFSFLCRAACCSRCSAFALLVVHAARPSHCSVFTLLGVYAARRSRSSAHTLLVVHAVIVVTVIVVVTTGSTLAADKTSVVSAAKTSVVAAAKKAATAATSAATSDISISSTTPWGGAFGATPQGVVDSIYDGPLMARNQILTGSPGRAWREGGGGGSGLAPDGQTWTDIWGSREGWAGFSEKSRVFP